MNDFIHTVMTIKHIDTLTNSGRNQMFRCCSKVPFYISLYDNKWSDTLGTTVYMFEFGYRVNDTEVKTFQTSHRFSELYELYEHLKKKYSDEFKKYEFKFPPKQWFFSNSASTVERRMKEMKEFFSRIGVLHELFRDDMFCGMFTNESVVLFDSMLEVDGSDDACMYDEE